MTSALALALLLLPAEKGLAPRPRAVETAQYLVEGRYLQSGTTHELTPPTTRRVVFAPFGISTNSQ